MTIKERIEKIRERIEKAALRSGRNPGEIRLMGVSKFHEPPEIEEAVKAGLFLFGESRVQEAVKKFPAIQEAYPAVELHLIGSLQRNKVKNALLVFDGLQTLDRDELITALGTQLQPGMQRQPDMQRQPGGTQLPPENAAAGTGKARQSTGLTVLLEMHTGEDSKAGYPDEDSLSRAVELIASFPGLKLSGLMTMAPLTNDEALIRQSFRKLVAARESLRRRFPQEDFSCLSMGMSGDFEIAIEEGSTLVRVGTAIFGEAD
jgi:uncharacterized pyridoxal phosphate-containing UPF0001 family protein